MAYDLPSEVLPMFGGTVKANPAQNLSGVNTVAPETLGGTAPLPTSTPPPPPSYMPKQAPDTRSSFVKFLEGFGAGVSDEIPIRLKMQIAQQEVQLNDAKIQEGWQNVTKTELLMKGMLQKQNADAAEDALSTFPNVLADIANYDPSDPQRKERGETWKKILGPLHPEMRNMIDYAVNNTAAVMATNYALRKSPEWQAQVKSRGYAQVMQEPGFVRYAKGLGNDMLPAATARMMGNKELRDKLHSGQMTQDELLDGLRETGFDVKMGPPIKPDEMQFIQEFARTPDGVETLAGMGVQVSKAALKRQETRATWTSEKDFRDQETRDLQAKKVAGTITPVENRRLDIYLGERAKESDVSNRPQSPMDRFLIPVSNGAAKSFGELADLMQKATVEGDVEKMATYQGWANKAKKDYRESSPQGRMAVQQTTPYDQLKNDFFSKKDLRNKNLSKVMSPITPQELQSGKSDLVPLTDKQQGDVASLITADKQSNELFGLASKVLTATTFFEATTQQIAGQDVVARNYGYATRHNPQFVTYVQELAAWSGRFARVLGTERGVMTDMDIDRWKATFPAPGDTKEVVAVKIKLFKKMLNYVYDVNTKMVTGDIDKSQIVDVGIDPNNKKDYSTGLKYADKTHRDTMEGFLGNLEQLSAGGNKGPTEPKRKKSASEGLLEQILLEENK